MIGVVARGQDSGSGREEEARVLSVENSIPLFIGRLREARTIVSAWWTNMILPSWQTLPESQPFVVPVSLVVDSITMFEYFF